MNTPGFTAAASLRAPQRASWTKAQDAGDPTAIVPQAINLGGFGGFGGFGPTLPSCHYEKQLVVCGSALPGYPVPMCWEWVYVCKFPGSSLGAIG